MMTGSGRHVLPFKGKVQGTDIKAGLVGLKISISKKKKKDARSFNFSFCRLYKRLLIYKLFLI
uniref:Uncharacterized protein n=1 Tax=Octopus bimaculoides TaxID=37653 RepID=A0A0L8HJ40_OCTBM